MPLKNDWEEGDFFGADDQNEVSDAVNANTEAVADLESDKAEKSTTISAGTGLTGGGDLSANRTISVNFGTSSGTVCQGNDTRLSNARTPTSHTHSGSDITSGTVALARLATGHVRGSVNGTATTLTVWIGTEAQFEALGSLDNNTIYLFTED